LLNLEEEQMSNLTPYAGAPTIDTTSVAIGDDRIVVAATLLSAQGVQKLIDRLLAVKGLLPDEAEKDEAAN
jgi:TRAP-type mannitol/chloroaromatic compound transport system permease small subunit